MSKSIREILNFQDLTQEEKTRRVEPAASTGGRRTAAPKYDIID